MPLDLGFLSFSSRFSLHFQLLTIALRILCSFVSMALPLALRHLFDYDTHPLHAEV